MWLNSWLSSDTCNRIVETANSLPLLTKICKFKQISGKKTLFSSTNYFFLLRLCFFFLSRPLFSISTSLFIQAQFFSPSATFSKPAPYSQSANFYCIFCWTARWPFKKTTLWLCFSAVILTFVFLSIGLSLGFTRLSSSIAFADRFAGWARNLKHSRRSHVWKKSRSQIAWGRGSWFPFQATVEWIEVFMQTAPYNILSIAQTT